MPKSSNDSTATIFSSGATNVEINDNMGNTYHTPPPGTEQYLNFKPHTPTPSRSLKSWHGLLSPDTPTFGNNTCDTLPAPASHHELGKQSYAPAQITCSEAGTAQEVIESDAHLALELDATKSPTALRRSSRITSKAKAQAPPARKNAKPAPVAQAPAPPEFSVVPFKADPIPFSGLPAVHSLDWQLQYPPGGSTHPSYPFPTPDPRLVFHEHLVPFKDELPDLSQVPNLVLPVGWKHVSWSGLLPIAFDPYRQAFKLTPVGPMPLTSEELHQNGLYKYVPGGAVHPETAHLPEMMVFSDGSDVDIYNWEGVDWVLPWAQISPPPCAAVSHGIYSGTTSQNASPTSAIITYPWRESRDCPNQIFDLADAWRWLEGKEEQPNSDFVPSSTKQWWGMGAYRSNRKLKSPIPELMMLAARSNPETPNEKPNPVLHNQDGREIRKNNLFCPFKSVATPMNVDITMLVDTEFTIKELLCYFPQHYNWGHAADRLVRAGMLPSLVRDMINMTRGLLGEVALKNSVVSSAINVAKRRVLIKRETDEDGDTVTIPEPDNEKVTNYTSEGWTYDIWEKIDYPILALAHGLVDLPTGCDAGPVTALIQWCRENSRYTALISEIPMLLKEAGIKSLIELSDSGCPDKEFPPRYAEAMKKDQNRVRQSLKDKKHGLLEAVDKEMAKKRRVG
ncbi:uncharacterized protein K460DRAFT_423099 [Cucurbitaria berberidis CBS 394.84]|uniref:Uncharacterized protein n=1 Tax=Cucurbitaria berberidis CBS 394.84 TaxID=1168544 RepID=A0A9P4GRV4_9PLEO|nr:uncharacterized protein K460DRAFT_423099 [Cucurbitaria berberidis CBS 394.84]KAF1850605.1 hypothetical protein K460DRAFT_423099 [Cucurbitaria berberidis CBS 394.84]